MLCSRRGVDYDVTDLIAKTVPITGRAWGPRPSGIVHDWCRKESQDWSVEYELEIVCEKSDGGEGAPVQDREGLRVRSRQGCGASRGG